jgi:hypothetical protein
MESITRGSKITDRNIASRMEIQKTVQEVQSKINFLMIQNLCTDVILGPVFP